MWCFVLRALRFGWMGSKFEFACRVRRGPASWISTRKGFVGLRGLHRLKNAESKYVQVSMYCINPFLCRQNTYLPIDVADILNERNEATVDYCQLFLSLRYGTTSSYPPLEYCCRHRILPSFEGILIISTKRKTRHDVSRIYPSFFKHDSQFGI